MGEQAASVILLHTHNRTICSRDLLGRLHSCPSLIAEEGGMTEKRGLDALDVALLAALREHPRAGALELARITGVARATVSARLQRLEDSGVVTGYGPDIDVGAAGFGVQAFVTLEIAQGAIEDVQRDLEAIPGLLEAPAETGSGDVLCGSRRFRTRHCSGSWWTSTGRRRWCARRASWPSPGWCPSARFRCWSPRLRPARGVPR